MPPLTAVAAGTGGPGTVLGGALPLASPHGRHTKKGYPTGRGGRRCMCEPLAYCVSMTYITVHETPLGDGSRSMTHGSVPKLRPCA